MTASGAIRDSKDAPHVCPCCGLPLVQPVDCRCAGDGQWLLTLLCPSCDWTGNRLLSETLVDRLEDELDEGMRQVKLLLTRMTQSNMCDYAERFADALAVDGILPEDF
jgi:hypothetical protein